MPSVGIGRRPSFMKSAAKDKRHVSTNESAKTATKSTYSASTLCSPTNSHSTRLSGSTNRKTVSPHVQSFHHFEKPTYLKSKEDEQQAHKRARIHRRTRHIIKLTPPRKVLPPNQILEDKPDEERRRKVDSRRRRNERNRVEQHRHADVLVPPIRVLAMPIPERNR